ncbi:MAG TPA: UDP-N-acetylglucosamine 2-epimerase (non-hydrolyzing) [Puia sp.]|nr:UDP-N-acetylglucosamine 2-epimerase (non-hydrolyzing) [Puia sp.]
MNIIHIVGNRPQFIKLSLLHGALSGHTRVRSRIIHTGQHFSENMSDVFFRECGLPDPHHQLGIHSLSHNEMIGRMLIALDSALAVERPDAVVVYGDTNTTLAASLAAKKRQVRLFHVEAGVRTGDESMPEEVNRYLSDRMADLNFTCTALCSNNLVGEGMPAARILDTGDLLLDASLRFADKARTLSTLPAALIPGGRPFILATIHRAANTGDPSALAAILQALHELHEEYPVVFPVHPHTRAVIEANGLPFRLIDTPPLGYLDMLALIQASNYVITDSGGLSREAFFFSKPSVVVMDRPFWPEILATGASLAAPADSKTIIRCFRALSSSGKRFHREVFGDGGAAQKIAGAILNHLHA